MGAEAAESTASVAAANLGNLIGLQEVDEREAQRRRAVRRGRLTLDALAHLRDALLMGMLPLPPLKSSNSSPRSAPPRPTPRWPPFQRDRGPRRRRNRQTRNGRRPRPTGVGGLQLAPRKPERE